MLPWWQAALTKPETQLLSLPSFQYTGLVLKQRSYRKGLKDHSAFDSWPTPEKEWYTLLKTCGVDTVVHYFKMIGLSRHIVYNDFLKIIRWNDISEDSQSSSAGDMRKL